MLESHLSRDLELFNTINSIFFVKSSSPIVSYISSNTSSKLSLSCCYISPSSYITSRRPGIDVDICRAGFEFFSVSLSVKGSHGFIGDSGQNGEKISDEETALIQGIGVKEEEVKVRGRASGAINTTKHLWAGAVAAMVSRTFVAPLERLKLEYIVRGEQKNLFELIKTIAATQGIKGFWKGNFVNILRTAPFKSINFYAYDTYRNQLLTMSGKEEATNFERFVAGAAAGITATLLCLPMDTVCVGLKIMLIFAYHS